MNGLSDHIVFAYKTHTNIRINFIFDYENFEVLAENDIYMGPWSIFSSLYFPNEIFSCNYFQTK